MGWKLEEERTRLGVEGGVGARHEEDRADDYGGRFQIVLRSMQWHLEVNPGQFQAVLIHMSLGFLWLALALSFFVLLPTMCVSFPLIFHRLQKVDLAFSVLSFGIGFLIIISQVLFVINCEMLSPKPKITYLMPTYLCWSAGVLMLSTGLLNYLNQLGMFSRRKLPTQHQQSFHRWASMQMNFKRESKVDAVGQPSRTTVST